jgi:predicted P-loop ATPase
MRSPITVLECLPEHFATKRWHVAPDGKPVREDFDAGKWFTCSPGTICGIEELSRMLSIIERDPRRFIIRGEPCPGVDLSRPVYRRSRERKGEPPTFREVADGVRWVCLDIDKVKVPAAVDLATAAGCELAIRFLISTLPVEFQDVTCHWQFSSSAGMLGAGTLSAHLWYWFDRPVRDAAIGHYAETLGLKIDRSLFHAVQPHYTAAPIFEGVVDPLPCRSGLLPGAQREVRADFGDESLACALLARHWPEKGGGQHQAQLALAGALLSSGWSNERALEVLDRVCPDDAERTLENTADRIGANEPVTAWRKLAEILGAEPAAKIRELLGCDDAQWERKLLRTDKGAVKTSLANALQVIASHKDWTGVLAYDERRLRAVFVAAPPWGEGHEGADARLPRDVTDADGARAVAWFARRYRAGFTSAMVLEAMNAVARQDSFDSVRDYFVGLTWDGVPRLDTWLTTYCGAADTTYIRAVAAKWAISAVARTFDPGCKVDTMIILEGNQGIGKSFGLRALAGADHFADSLPDLEHKDAKQYVHGPLIVEVAELDAFNKKDATAIKSFLTMQVDRFRPPYGRTTEDFPRRCVFAGTTNKEAYLRDETGGRRFWPVRVTRCDVGGIARARDQLWGEAVARYHAAEAWWLDAMGEVAARAEQDARHEDHPYTEKIVAALERGVPQRGQWGPKVDVWTIPPNAADVSVAELLEHVLELPRSTWSAVQRDIGRILIRLGWTRRQVRQAIGQGRTWRYFRPLHQMVHQLAVPSGARSAN